MIFARREHGEGCLPEVVQAPKPFRAIALDDTRRFPTHVFHQLDVVRAELATYAKQHANCRTLQGTGTHYSRTSPDATLKLLLVATASGHRGIQAAMDVSGYGAAACQILGAVSDREGGNGVFLLPQLPEAFHASDHRWVVICDEFVVHHIIMNEVSRYSPNLSTCSYGTSDPSAIRCRIGAVAAATPLVIAATGDALAGWLCPGQERRNEWRSELRHRPMGLYLGLSIELRDGNGDLSSHARNGF